MYEPIKDETKEQYLKIWTHYSVGHLRHDQLAALFDCSHDTVANAINWAAENRAQFQSQILAEAAKEAIESRLRELRSDLVRIKEENPIQWNMVIGMQKLIKENEELLWRLQSVIQDRSIITVNTAQINQVVRARDEIVEGMSEDERQALISRIREAVGKPGDDQRAAG
jgi:hypothetical protein